MPKSQQVFSDAADRMEQKAEERWLKSWGRDDVCL